MTLGIGVSEVVWGAMFFYWCTMEGFYLDFNKNNAKRKND